MKNLNYSDNASVTMADATDVSPTILEAEDLYSQGDAESAAKLFIDAIESDSGSIRAWNGLGVCLFQLGDLQAAVEALEAALVLDENDLPALSNLNQIYWMSGYRKQAVSIARRVMQFLPSSQELWNQLCQTGVECSDRPEALLISTGLEMGNVFANVAMGLEEANFVIRGLGPDLTGMLSSTGDPADLKVIQHLLDAASPSVVVLSAAMPSLAVVQAMAMEKGIPVLLLGGWQGTGTPAGVVGMPLNADEDLVSQVCGQVRSLVQATETTRVFGVPLITLVLDAEAMGNSVVDCLDKLLFQGVHPGFFEVVIVAREPVDVQDQICFSSPPFSLTIAAQDASMEEVARGKVVVTVPIENLDEPGVLVSRIYETCSS